MILGIRIPFPLNEVLEFVSSSPSSGIQDGIDFVFFFPIDKVRWRFNEVQPMHIGFLVRGQEVDMKHIVDLP